MTQHSEGGWIKATASNGGGDCVELRQLDQHVQIRDSKLGTSSPIHTLSSIGFAAWLQGAKNGEYDSLS